MSSRKSTSISGKMTKRQAFGLLADRALLSGDEEVAMAFLLSHKHLLRSHPTRVLTERWIKQYPFHPPSNFCLPFSYWIYIAPLIFILIYIYCFNYLSAVL
jgi:hypothetical protein